MWSFPTQAKSTNQSYRWFPLCRFPLRFGVRLFVFVYHGPPVFRHAPMVRNVVKGTTVKYRWSEKWYWPSSWIWQKK
jgi:hypothetical protein